jgi:hypothetical protein
MPPMMSGSLSSRAAFTCGRPRFSVGLGLSEGAADRDGEEAGEEAGVAVGRVVGEAGDGEAGVAPAQPASRIAAQPTLSKVVKN